MPIVDSAMTAYEALDLLTSGSSVFDQIFGYWVSVSFAVIAGSFIAREHISFPLMLTIVVMYAIASFMFASRFYSQFQLMSEVMGHPAVPDQFITSLEVLGPMRTYTFLLGVIITETFVLYTYIKRGDT